MKNRSPLTLTLTIISAILTTTVPAVLAQRQPSANQIYIDKNCQRNQQLPQLERFTIFSRNEFTTNGQNYWFYAARYQDGGVVFCISKPNFNQPKPINEQKIQANFIDKIARDPNTKTAFIIAVREGNGPEAPVKNYGAARYQDGGVVFCISKPNFNQPKPINEQKIQANFIDKIARDPNTKTAFIIAVREGNGPEAPVKNYGLELSNVDRPKLTSLAILKQRGTLKDGDSHQHTFQGRAGQSITIDLKSRAFDHNITLFDTSGKKIAEKTGNSQNRRESQLTVKLPSNGTYKIVVKGGDRTSKGSYSLSINSNQL